MAEVTLNVGGYNYQVACRDGEEAHLQRLGQLVDAKAGEARAAVGNASEVRQLLFSALLFADESLDSKGGAPQAAARTAPSLDPALLETLADRVEALAARVEKLGAGA